MSDRLARLADLTARRARMAEDLEWAEKDWRREVAAALAEERATDIAKVAGISRARVYQIKDEER